MTAPSTHDATFYVRIHAERGPSYWGSKIQRLKAGWVTQSKPSNLPKDTVAVKLTVRLPDEVFEALTPEAVIVVPAELVQRAIEVQAGDAT